MNQRHKIFSANSLHLFMLLLFSCLQMQGQTTIYEFEIKEEIDAPAWRKTKVAIEQALKDSVDLILLRLDTYGGRVDFADSIRTKILECPIPVAVWIENNAASAGALISIACDSIYMKGGASIGAATVVNAEGTPAPEKYQSFFRSKMRATAIANGRNPNIAEAMVDPKIIIDSLVDAETLVTFTSEEAASNGYCEAIVNSKSELLDALTFPDARVITHQVSTPEKLILFLISPAVSSILIMLLIGGLYFEIQSPGLGLAGLIALISAILLFTPLYLHDLMDNYEVVIILLGLLLIALEIFVVPGFGVTGVAGGVFLVGGIALSLIGKAPSSLGTPLPAFSDAVRAIALVLVSCVSGFLLTFYLAKKLITQGSSFGRKAMLVTTQTGERIKPNNNTSFQELIGREGEALTALRPGGKVMIEGSSYDALSKNDFIGKGSPIKVIHTSNSQLVVTLSSNQPSSSKL